MRDLLFSPPFSPIFVCKRCLAFIFTPLCAFPVKREKTSLWNNLWGPGKLFVILFPLRCTGFPWAGRKLSSRVEEVIQGSHSYSQFNLMILIFLLFHMHLFGVYPNCITRVILHAWKCSHLRIQDQTPACCHVLLPRLRGSPFLEMSFRLGGPSKHTPSPRRALVHCWASLLDGGLLPSPCPASEDCHFSESVPVPSVFMFHCICNTDLSLALHSLPEPFSQVTVWGLYLHCSLGHWN